MAFVFKSDRKTTLGDTKSTNLGPGQYIDPDNYSKLKKTYQAPFLTTTNRNYATNMSTKEIFPGPGSYYPPENYNKTFARHQDDQNQKINPIYKNLEYEMPTSFEKLGFNSKEKRFNNFENIEETPGPGQYDNTKQKKVKKTKAKYKPHHYESDVNNANKTITIPSKNRCFGYDFLPDQKLVLAEDPLKFIKYQGEKNDSVGPGAYEVNNQKQWFAKGTTWSKFKTKKSIFPDTKNDNKIRTSKSFTNEENFAQKRKEEKEKLFKYLKDRALKKKKNVEDQNNLKLDKVEKIIKNETPGPGYYDDLNPNSLGPKIPQGFQFFGSMSERFPGQGNLNEKIGPGCYFRDDTRLSVAQKKKTAKAPFNSKANRDFSEKVKDVPGPGLYDPNVDVKKKNFSTKTIFSSSNKRFVENENLVVPGPGSYLKNDNNILNELKNVKRYKFSAPFRSPQRNFDDFNKKNEEIPPIGWYNSDYIFNMSYNVGKKAFRPTMVNAPFNSLKKRFEEIKSLNSNGGPGQYFKETKMGVSNNNQFLPPFKQSEKRFKEYKKEFDTAPGIYNLSSHFDWNKKTYNVNFL